MGLPSCRDDVPASARLHASMVVSPRAGPRPPRSAGRTRMPFKINPRVSGLIEAAKNMSTRPKNRVANAVEMEATNQLRCQLPLIERRRGSAARSTSDDGTSPSHAAVSLNIPAYSGIPQHIRPTLPAASMRAVSTFVTSAARGAADPADGAGSRDRAPPESSARADLRSRSGAAIGGLPPQRFRNPHQARTRAI